MEKKIRLITFHTPRNYGAVLQAYSLSKYLEKYSDDVQVIDYDTEHLRAIYPIIPRVSNWKGILKNILFAYRFPYVKKKQVKFHKFVVDNFSLTEKFTNTVELYAQDWKGCSFVTGSDQVFNPNRIADERKAFYLDFAPTDEKRIAYAASFGVKEIQDDKKTEISEYLQRFTDIAVREESGRAIVEKLVCRTPTVVLDPVFLHEKEFWKKMGIPYRKQFDKYLFYYNLMESQESDLIARKIADEKGLRLVVITEGTLHIHADNVLRDVGPEEFLYLMSNAAFIVTDSFHGVAFSIIFEKQFVFSDEKEMINSRGLELLDRLELRTSAYSKTYAEGNEIDYKNVKLKLQKYLDDARCYLDNAFMF